MARRRLTPPFRSVMEEEPIARISAHPPIAQVAGEAAATAALQEVTETLAEARRTGRMVVDLPLESVIADHLARDRILADDDEMRALRDSLAAHGQRTPIEVTPLEGERWGLISGWRRLTALGQLHGETGEERFATVQALIRMPETAGDAYVAMVEENEIRVGLNHYERARIVALSAERGVFPDEASALKALFGNVSRAKRSKIGSFLKVYHALDQELRFPGAIGERLGLRLAQALEGRGTAKLLKQALKDADAQLPEAEQAAMEAVLTVPVKAQGRSPVTPEIREIREGLRMAITPGAGGLKVTLTGTRVTDDLCRWLEEALSQDPE